MAGFFVTGEAAIKRHAEIAERDRIHHEKQTAQASVIENAIVAADNDREAAQLIALAQLLSPDSWASRQTWLDIAERSRQGRESNAADQRAYERNRNMAALAVEYSLRKAERARDLVRSWG